MSHSSAYSFYNQSHMFFRPWPCSLRAAFTSQNPNPIRAAASSFNAISACAFFFGLSEREKTFHVAPLVTSLSCIVFHEDCLGPSILQGSTQQPQLSPPGRFREWPCNPNIPMDPLPESGDPGSNPHSKAPPFQPTVTKAGHEQHLTPNQQRPSLIQQFPCLKPLHPYLNYPLPRLHHLIIYLKLRSS